MDGSEDQDVTAAKAELRRRRQTARGDMTETARTAARAALTAAVLARVAAERWRCVAAYVPLRTEPGSPELLTALHTAGVRVLVPITLPDRDLDWSEWSVDRADGAEGGVDGSEGGVGGVRRGLGVQAVGAAQAVLVPAFAVGDDGMRLGRGGGSYDRALPRCSANAETAALLYDGEREPQVPSQPWDRRVLSVVTPSGWVRLGWNTDVERPR